jgi:hypothetical protein
LLLLASLLAAQFSESAIVQQRQTAALAQQLAADRLAVALLGREPNAVAWNCRIGEALRCDDTAVYARRTVAQQIATGSIPNSNRVRR